MSRFLVIVVTLITSFASSGYSQKYNFRNFTVNEGLTQSEIYSICEDKRGNLWFGSLGGGLIRFDGYTFMNYREEDGLVNNFVHVIVEDSRGDLLIGTEAGLCKFDGKVFKTFNKPGDPGKTFIRSIVEDDAQNIWIGTAQEGLFKFKNNRFESFTKQTGLPDNTINCLFIDTEQTLWIGTNKGVCNYKNHQFTKYTKDEGLIANNIRAITCDKSGNMWFASLSSGISRYNGQIFTNYTVESGLSSNTVYSAITDHKGRVWLGTANGLSMYDGQSFQNYFDTNGLAGNVVLCIKEDSSNDLWFGTSGGGVSRLDNTRFIHYNENEKMGKQVYAVIQALNGKMIFATSAGGLTLFDGTNYSTLKGNGNFTNSKIKSLFYDHYGSLWMGTVTDGAYQFSTDGFHHYTVTDSLCSNNINGFAADTSNNLWFSSPDSGICVYTRSHTFKYFTNKNGLISNVINAITADNNGNVWIGTDKGLNKATICETDSVAAKITSYTHNNGLSNSAVRAVVVDKFSTVFAGTAGGGINILKGDSIFTIDKRNGLCSNNIYAMLIDNSGNLWVGTEQGIDRITLNDRFTITEYRHFGKNEGFTGIEVFRNSCFKDNDGRLWFGTVNGATVYNPKDDIPYKISPKTHITGIKLFYDNIENTAFGDSLQSWYPIPKTLILPHHKNSLTFNFIGIYQRNPESVRYKWKLEGLNSDWSPPLNQHNVTYSNLPPGKYTFMVMSCNEYNIWNPDPETFEFEIRPPYWKTWWFLMASCILTIGGSWYIFHSRLLKIKEKNRIENEKLEMRMNIIELEQEAHRLQMNPHFIFNALNSIQGIISTSDIYGAKSYLVKFARLMRLILENAREKFIPLQNEIEMLEHYMELERLSKNNKFEFSISVGSSIDTEMIEIPPMMIQPFVENAIVHGIKNKEGQGKIDISFVLSQTTLTCEIIDDGIGRAAAAVIKAKTNIKHKSTGILVTQKRLEQLKNQAGTHAGFIITDLNIVDNATSGTRVIITIPVDI